MPVRNDFVWRGFLPDADDDMVVEAAFNGSAAALVTFNTRDFADLKSRLPFRIQTPGQFLQFWEAL